MIPPVGLHIRIAKELKSEIEVEGIKFRQGFKQKKIKNSFPFFFYYPEKRPFDNVEIPVDLLHRHPAYWPRPDEFYPERFIDDPNLVKASYYMPFGGGPRNCIGMFFYVR